MKVRTSHGMSAVAASVLLLCSLRACASEMPAFDRIASEYHLEKSIDTNRTILTASANTQWADTVIWQGAHVCALEVDPQQRNKGLGSYLFCTALNHIQQAGYPQAHWYAYQSTDYYHRFGARIESTSSIDPRSSYMYFDFTRDGNPKDHLMRLANKQTNI